MKVITKDQFYLEQIEALKKKITQEREGVEEFKQMMNDAFKDLEAERDALASQVEVLRQAGNQVINYGLNANYWVHAVSQPPAACLAQVRTEAGRAGFIDGTKLLMGDRETNADEYAERILKGEVK